MLFERVLHPYGMPPERARPVWERFVQLEMCLSKTGGSLSKVQSIENRMNEVTIEVLVGAVVVVQCWVVAVVVVVVLVVVE